MKAVIVSLSKVVFYYYLKLYCFNQVSEVPRGLCRLLKIFKQIISTQNFSQHLIYKEIINISKINRNFYFILISLLRAEVRSQKIAFKNHNGAYKKQLWKEYTNWFSRYMQTDGHSDSFIIGCFGILIIVFER